MHLFWHHWTLQTVGWHHFQHSLTVNSEMTATDPRIEKDAGNRTPRVSSPSTSPSVGSAIGAKLKGKASQTGCWVVLTKKQQVKNPTVSFHSRFEKLSLQGFGWISVQMSNSATAWHFSVFLLKHVGHHHPMDVEDVHQAVAWWERFGEMKVMMI